MAAYCIRSTALTLRRYSLTVEDVRPTEKEFLPLPSTVVVVIAVGGGRVPRAPPQGRQVLNGLNALPGRGRPLPINIHPRVQGPF